MKYFELIGIPYSEKDCWGIVVDFYKLEFGIELKNYYDAPPNDIGKANKLIYSSMGDFEKVSDLKIGTILLISFKGIESHIAVYVGEGKILHSYDPVGCVIEPISKWEKLITGYYRIKNDKTKTETT